MGNHTATRSRSRASAAAGGVRAKEKLIPEGIQYALEYSGSKGIVQIHEHGEAGYFVLHYESRDHLRYGVSDSRQNTGTVAGVNAILRQIGYSNVFDYGMLHGGAAPKASGTGKGSRSRAATTISRGAEWRNARPGSALGRYEVAVGDHDISLERAPGGGFKMSDTDRITGRTTTASARSVDDAAAYLERLGAPSAFSRSIAGIAEHDIARYVEGTRTAAQQARISATNSRRAALDAKFGAYTPERAATVMQGIFAKAPGLEEGIYSHLIGGSYLSPKGAVDAIRSERPVSEAEARAIRSAFTQMRQASEWSVLHSPNVTPEGTIRLWHGTNGQSSPDTWRQRFSSAGGLQATPFTTNWRVAEHFAESGPHGRTVISAHVPASSVLTWYGVSQSQSWGDEEEYTVGGGTISDFQFLNIPDSVE